jgi:hypothetical protein
MDINASNYSLAAAYDRLQPTTTAHDALGELVVPGDYVWIFDPQLTEQERAYYAVLNKGQRIPTVPNMVVYDGAYTPSNYNADEAYVDFKINQIGTIAFIEEILGVSVADFLIGQYDDQILNHDVLRRVLNVYAEFGELALNQMLNIDIADELSDWLDRYDGSIVKDYLDAQETVWGE